MASDALLALLHPGWRLVIGVCVAATVIVAGARLMQRGPSRMTSAMGVTVVILVLLVAVTLLFG
ncbi:MAG TPA: hypothetical protein VFZ32_00970 [Micromonosporaceae bacterium]|jgi:hypothetical protein